MIPCLPRNKKAAAAPTLVGFAGGSAGMAVVPLQPRDSASPSFDGFALSSVTYSLTVVKACPTLLRADALRYIRRRSNAVPRHVYGEASWTTRVEESGASSLPANPANTPTDQRGNLAHNGKGIRPSKHRLIGAKP